MEAPTGTDNQRIANQSLRLGQSNWLGWVVVGVVALLLISFAGYLDFLYTARNEDNTRSEVSAELSVLRSNIEGRINTNIQTVMGMVAVIAAEPDISQQRFSSIARNLFLDKTELINIGAAPDLVLSMVHPLEGNESAIGLDYRKNEAQRDAALKSLDSGILSIAGPLNLVQGGVGIIGRIPVYVTTPSGEKRPWGLVSAVMNAEQLYDSSGLSKARQRYDIAIRGKDGKGIEGDVFFGEANVFNEKPVITTIVLPNGTWKMAAVPKGGWQPGGAAQWWLRVFLGIAIALVLTPLIFLIRANQQRRDSDLRLRALFDLSPIGIALNDKTTGSFIEFNQALLNATGYTREEFKQLTYWQLTPQEYELEEAQQIESLNATGRYGPYEKEYNNKLGHRVPVVLNGLLIKDGYGNEFIWSIIEDISERKANEIKLAEHHEQLEMVLDSTEVGIWDWNLKTGVVNINERWANIYGYTITELTPMTTERWQSMVNPDDFCRSLSLLERHWKRQEVRFVDETRVRHKDGHWVWVLESGKVVERDDAGKPVRMVGTHLDISKQKNSQLLVERSREELQKFFDLSSNLVFIGRLQDRFEKINNAFANVLGWDERHVLTHTFLNFVHPDDIASTEDSLALLNEHNTAITFSNRYQTRNGQSISVIWNIAYDSITHQVYGSGIDVTELLSAQEKLAETQKEVKSFFDVSDTFMAIFSIDGRIRKANHALISASGLSEEDVIGSHFTRFTAPEETHLIQKAQHDLVTKGKLPPLKCTFISENNEPLILLWRFALHPNQSLFYATAIDITEQERAKEKIQHQEFLLQEMSNQAKIGAWEWNVTTNTLIWSSMTKKLHDLPEDAEIDADESILYFKEGAERDKMKRLIARCVKAGEPYDVETQVVTATGRAIWANLTGRAEFQNGRCIRMYGSFQDIDARKKADALLQKTNTELQSQMMLLQVIAKSLTKFIAYSDINTAFNEILSDLLTITDSQFGFIGEVLQTDDNKPYLKAYAISDLSWDEQSRRLYENKSSEGMEFFNLDNLFGRVITTKEAIITNDPANDMRSSGVPPGHPTLHSFLGLPIERNNEVIAVAGIANRAEGYDEGLVYWLQPLMVTIGQIVEGIYIQREKARAEKELVGAMNAAEAAVKAKGEFLATMSHEIRTPMNGILGMLNLLQKSELTNTQRHKLEIAKNSADSLLILINDILDFSKVDAGKLELEVLEFDIRSIFDDLCESMALRAEEKHVELLLDLAPLDFVRVKGDPSRIRQILTNLLGNALKFSQQGNVTIAADLKTIDETLWLTASVSDTGIGIAEDKLSDLFTPFTQVDASTTRQFGGTGLGLAICKKLCNAMGGDITVSSVLGEGSSFTFNIPLEFVEKKIPEFLQSSGLHILLSIQNEKSRASLEKQLSTWNLPFTTLPKWTDAHNELETSFINKTNKPDHCKCLALLEFTTTDDLESLDVFREQAAQHCNNLCIVPVLPFNFSGSPSELADHGLNSCLYKPLSVEDLLFAINSTLSGNEVEFFTQPEATSSSDYQWPNDTRILLVDDNAINIEVAKLLLSEFNLEADIANNGREALQMLQDSEIDPYTLIFMDCQMPIMDGYEATRAIRKGDAGSDFCEIPILAMTANAMTGDKDKCFEAGMSDYLSKPINETQLLAKLQRWLGSTSDGDNSVVPRATNTATKRLSMPRVHKPEPTQRVEDNVSFTDYETWDCDAALTMLKGRRDRLELLLKMFCDASPERLSSIEDHYAHNDREGVRFIAHAIKGSAGQLKATKLHHIAAAVELAAKTNDDKKMIALKNDFIDGFNTTIRAFRTYLN